MTTIAYKSGILAADTLVVQGDDPWAYAKKIKKVKGWLIGSAGDASLCAAFMKKFDPAVIREDRIVPIGTAHDSDDAELNTIIVSPKGKVYTMYTSGVFEEIKPIKNCFAVGYGTMGALCAMYAGASAIEAVRSTMVYTGCVGGKVDYIKLSRTSKTK